MTTKIWNFLLPATGNHQLRVEHIGTQRQMVFCDSEQLTSQHQERGAQNTFAGPENAVLELRHQSKSWAPFSTTSSPSEWALHVNGWVVEDYNSNRRSSGDESLRELKHKPDGSYLIAPNFDMSELELNIVRKFQFMIGERLHEVQVAHADCIWQVGVDGQLVSREAHKITDAAGEASFTLSGPSGEHVPAVVTMEWPATSLDPSVKAWVYRLMVGSVDVPCSWTKVGGAVQPLTAQPPVAYPSVSHTYTYEQPPEQLPAPPPFPATPSTVDTAPPPDVLPQGVSFDYAAGKYQANIRNRAGKFIFLGEFMSAEEAHYAYLQAVPVHCPDKHLVPGFAG